MILTAVIVIAALAADLHLRLHSHPARIRARRGLHARPLHRDQGSRAVSAGAVRAADGARRSARRGRRSSAAGRDFARQRLGQGQRRHLFPRRRSRARHHPGQQLPDGDEPARPDHAALGAWASTTSTRCWPSATSSTPTSRTCSTSRPKAGASRSPMSRSSASISTRAWSAPSRARPRPSATRRAKIINAEGEQQAAQKLVEAARILAPVPQAMQLRYLGTLFDIAGERSSTIVFPFPIELTQAFAAMAQRT